MPTPSAVTGGDALANHPGHLRDSAPCSSRDAEAHLPARFRVSINNSGQPPSKFTDGAEFTDLVSIAGRD